MGHIKITKRESELEASLTDKETVFCKNYLATYNGLESAKAANYKSPGVQSAQLLTKPKIQRYLKFHQTRLLDGLELSAEEIHAEIAHIVRQRATDIYDGDGKIISNPHEMDERANATIESMEEESWVDSDGETHRKLKIKRINKMEALKLAVSIRGMAAPEKHQVMTGNVLDWDGLYGKPEGAEMPDKIEEV